MDNIFEITQNHAVSPSTRLGPCEAEANLRLLIVEDCEEDVELAVLELSQHGYHSVYKRVETLEQMQKALGEESWDIILSDRCLPRFSSEEALECLKRSGRDIPFIILSGSMGEDLAVKAMRSGAHDYLLKGDLSRLPSAIERELKQVQARHYRDALEGALRKSIDLYELVLRATNDVVWELDTAASRIWWSSNMHTVFGYPPEEAQADPAWFLERVHPDDRAGVMPRFEKKLGTANEPWTGEYRFRRANGIYAFVSDRSFPHPDSKHKLNYVGAISDISARKLAELKHHESDRRFEMFMQKLPSAACIKDESGRFLFCNEAVSEALGKTRAEILGKTILELIPDPEATLMHRSDMEALAAGTGTVVTQSLLSLPGSEPRYWESFKFCFNDSDGKQVLGDMSFDITSRKNLEAQLAQSQKMEAFGQLAGGIAHDFNNLLTAIVSPAEMMLREISPGDKNRKWIEMIKQAGDSATTLVGQLLAFSRRQIVRPQVLDLNELLLTTEKMLRRIIGESIEVRVNAQSDLGHVKADSGQLEQVVVNLAVNARDAMPYGGKLTLETKNVILNGDPGADRWPPTPTPYVALIFRDTGLGMTKEVQARLFEPFFTTKEPGQGTGLGLATCFGIVKQAGGYITVDSEVGRGTVFTVFLPRVDLPTEAPAFSRYREDLPGGDEVILLVEDDPLVRQLGAMILSEKGYVVIEAGNGIEALQEISQRQPGEIDLVLSDLVMPKMSGLQLSVELKILSPQTSVLFTSGYTTDTSVRQGLFDSRYGFLEKPFSPASLLAKVRQVLDERLSRTNG